MFVLLLQLFGDARPLFFMLYALLLFMLLFICLVYVVYVKVLLVLMQKFCGELGRFAETGMSPQISPILRKSPQFSENIPTIWKSPNCHKMTKKYWDLRRRIYTKNTRKISKSCLVKFPTWHPYSRSQRQPTATTGNHRQPKADRLNIRNRNR